MKLGRNDPCHCGSGKKYKHCHYDEDRKAEAEALNKAAAEAAAKAEAEAAESEEEGDDNPDPVTHGKHHGSKFMRDSGHEKHSQKGAGGSGAPRVNRGAQRGG